MMNFMWYDYLAFVGLIAAGVAIGSLISSYVTYKVATSKRVMKKYFKRVTEGTVNAVSDLLEMFMFMITNR